jgi:Rrf2 family protein
MSQKNVQFAVATHIATVLGYFYGEDVTSATLAASVNAEPTFVRRSIAKLSRAGIVNTSRGKNGACCLARSPEEISLLDIYRASEAPEAFALHGYPAQDACPVSSCFQSCMSQVLTEAQQSFEAALRGRSLAALVANIGKSGLMRPSTQAVRMK